MKKVSISAVVFILILAFTVPVFGQGAFSYTSGIQVQNLEAADATIALTYYNQDGTIDATVSDTITASGSKTYFPLGASAGFNGSVIISSDRKVAAIANILGDNGVASASYVGTDAGATTVQLPLLMKNNSGFNTWYNVQNVGSAATSVSIAYSDGTTAGPVTIQPGASQTFFQANETHSSSVFSAVVTSSSQPVVATVIEESSDVMFAYSGFANGSTNPVFPLINANNAGYITGTQIQNLGGADTTVTVTYTPSSAGTACTETQTIPAGQSATFTLNAFANGSNSTCTAGSKFIGSAQVTSNSASQPLAAIVNQLLPGTNGEAYGSFDPAQATSTVVLPLIMDRNGGFFTGFNIMHVGGPDATVTCTFTGSSYTASATLSAGDALTNLQNGNIANGYVGSATCTADNASAKIVGIVNELGSSSTSDQLLVYEGISGQ